MQFISADDIEKVSQAVAKAELKTSGEIVPMIVKRSSMIGHVPMQLLSLWVIFLFVIHTGFEHWLYDLIAPWWFIVIGVVGAPFVWMAARIPFLQRLCVPADDREFEVFERAQLEFNWLKVHKTKERTGILIFVSLMEHQCVVLADEGIAAKLPPETWQGVVNQVIVGIKNRKPAEGLIGAVETCGSLLAQYFPATDTKNELPNSLVVKD